MHTFRVTLDITARSKRRARQQAEVAHAMIETAIQHEQDFDLNADRDEQYVLGIEDIATTRSDVARMYGVADDDEANTLESVRIKAGLAWKCQSCRNINEEGDRKCMDCKTRRPR